MGEGEFWRDDLSLMEDEKITPSADGIRVDEIEPPEELSGEAQADDPNSDLPKRGDLLQGVVLEENPDGVLIQINGKSVGLVLQKEIEKIPEDERSELAQGAQVQVLVVKPRGPNGKVVLSIEKAKQELDWRWAEELMATQEPYETSICGYNKGGILVQMRQLVGFTPGSQLDPNRPNIKQSASPGERWGHLVGEPIMIKVIEVDRHRNRLILSEKAAQKEWREVKRERLLDQIKEGDTLEGRVSNLANFGVFVDLGGVDGLIHLSELTWKRVNHPRQIIQVDDIVKVYVLNVDRERKRIGLSLKRLESDPWLAVEDTLPIGSLIDATVTNITAFGAFARPLEMEEIEGLIHISEISNERIAHPGDKLEAGQVVTLRVIGIDTHRRRLALSLKQVISDEYMDEDWGDEFSDY